MQKEHLIGAVIGVIISVAGGLLSLNSAEIKAGLCGPAAAVQAVK